MRTRAGGTSAKRRNAAVTFFLTGLILMPVAAQAEGRWTSNYQNVFTPFESRRWQDNNVDGANTEKYMSGCRGPNPAYTSISGTFNLYRALSFRPDEDRGGRTFACYGSARAGWGRVPSGEYHFTLKAVNGSSSGGAFSANYVETNY